MAAPVLLAQGGDDVAEIEEAHVDVNSFLQPLPFGLGLLLPLAPFQVHEVKLGDGESLPVRDPPLAGSLQDGHGRSPSR